ncbi:MAG: ABC transporter permease [Thermomicrobiales bacterium]|nr:ABC transporter permease [Thermomicrobiales bacterium]MCO5220338.1 ABC transporter permease [Thermomicrobiales bacterium]
MGRYILRRLLIAIPILFAITLIVFSIQQLSPGDPLNAYLPPDFAVPEAQKEAMRKQLGLDKPFLTRYGYWLKEAVQGNLGTSIRTHETVVHAISSRVGATLLLMGTALFVGTLLGVIFGVVAAVRQYSILDGFLTLFAFMGISTPVYLTGLLALYVFALRLGWFPAGGYSTPGQPFSVVDRIEHLILPAAIIAVNYIAQTMRYTRSAMLEVLGQDYVRTARAKGLNDRIVIARHAFRNALLPIVTLIGASIPALIGGAIFIESIFGWPGVGRLLLSGVEARDYPIIIGITFVLAIVTLVANLATDVVYAFVDPRIRLD